jgi:hypothetical protein
VLHDISRLQEYAGPIESTQTGGDATEPPPVEKVFGDAFRLRQKRSGGG